MLTTKIIAQKPLTPREVKAWRQAKELSAAQLAEKLGYKSRGYIKSIEGGSFAITAQFAAKFFALVARWPDEPHYETPRATSMASSRYKLPRQVTIEARPRRCRQCREWFVFAWANQRTCRKCKRK